MFGRALCCCSRDAWDTLSLSLAATSERKPWESGFVGCRAARGSRPVLQYCCYSWWWIPNIQIYLVSLYYCILICFSLVELHVVSIYIYIYIYTHTQGVPGGNVPDFGRMFVKLKYTDITQNTYIRSWTVTEIMVREKCGLLAVPHTVPGLRVVLPIHCTCLSFTLQPGQAHSCCAFIINSCNCYS